MKIYAYTKAEIDKIVESANFTQDERATFDLLSKNKSIKEIAFKIGVSTRTVDRLIRAIKDKIERI